MWLEIASALLASAAAWPAAPAACDGFLSGNSLAPSAFFRLLDADSGTRPNVASRARALDRYISRGHGACLHAAVSLFRLVHPGHGSIRHALAQPARSRCSRPPHRAGAAGGPGGSGAWREDRNVAGCDGVADGGSESASRHGAGTLRVLNTTAVIMHTTLFVAAHIAAAYAKRCVAGRLSLLRNDPFPLYFE